MTHSSKRGFTLIELLVVIAIIAILAAILFPVFARARATALMRQCASNAKQMGVAVFTYLGDYDGTYPMNRFPDATHHFSNDWGALHGSCWDWRRAVDPYLKSRQVQFCPGNTNAWSRTWNSWPGLESNHCRGNIGDSPNTRSDWLPNSYSYNGTWFHESAYQWYISPRDRPTQQALKTSMMRAPAELIYILESRIAPADLGYWVIDWNPDDPNLACYKLDGWKSGWTSCFMVHGGGMMNWIFADTHAKTLRLAQTIFPKQYWTDTEYYAGSDANHLSQKIMEDEYNAATAMELKQ